jgi:hypothetical protein
MNSAKSPTTQKTQAVLKIPAGILELRLKIQMVWVRFTS